MTNKVIVATEQDSIVRLYVGIPQNGGMDQTAQFKSSRPIDPTDLANMAVDLSAQFGWLEVQSSSDQPPAQQIAKPELKQIGTQDGYVTREREAVACEVCKDVMTRGSLQRHMEDRHGWNHKRALTAEREAVALPAQEGEIWKQKVRCPLSDRDQCRMGETARSNLVRHLEAKTIHALSHKQAVDVAREAVAVGPAGPRVQKKPRTNRQGLVGARLLETEVLPAVYEWVGAQTAPVTGKDVARKFGVGQSSGLDYLKKLQAKGMVDIVTNEHRRGQPLLFVALQPQPEPPADLPSSHLADRDRLRAPLEAVGDLPSESIRQYDQGTESLTERNEQNG